MIGSLLKEIPPISEMKKGETGNEHTWQKGENDSLLSAMPVVEKIVNRKSVSWRSEASDIVQRIYVRLLSWRNKYREKSEKMSPDDWKSLAARTSFNELNRFAKKDRAIIEMPLESIAQLAAPEAIEGQTEAEFRSLTNHIWKNFCELSLRQRQALLLGSYELAVFLLTAGITDKEIAESLKIALPEWLEVKDKLPVKKGDLARLLKQLDEKKSVEALTNSMKKARSLARQKVRRVTDK